MYKPEDVKIIVGGHVIEGFADGDMLTIHKEGYKKSEAKVDRVKTKQVEVRYCVIGAGPVGHPEIIFKKICEQQRWDIVEATPHSIGDCWIFKVQIYNDSHNAYLPSYVRILEEKK